MHVKVGIEKVVGLQATPAALTRFWDVAVAQWQYIWHIYVTNVKAANVIVLL